MDERVCIAIDLKSFYASVECRERGLDPLDTNLVVADRKRSEKTICLAVSPSMKALGIPGRCRLFEAEEAVQDFNANRIRKAPGRKFTGSSWSRSELGSNPSLSLDYIAAPPRMALYIDYSTRIYRTYLKYIAPEDIHVYSIDEVFMDVTDYLSSYRLSPEELARTMILDVLNTTGITATAGIGTNLYLAKYGRKAVFIIPSGNVGNATGAYWAKAMGAPIESIVLAANANKPITDYLESGEYRPRPSVKTLANAMDVGAPSNIERLFALFPDYDSFKANVSAYSVSDDEILRTIKEVYDETGYVICPHTACGERVRRDHVESPYSVVVSTAHPAKFNDIVEPLLGCTIAIPKNLYDIMQKPSKAKEIAADYHNIF